MDQLDWKDADYGERITSLVGPLRRLQKIGELSDAEHDEASELAFAIVEIEEAAREISRWSNQLGRIDGVGDSELIEKLWEMGDILRHLLSHAQSARFFAAYLDQTDHG